MKLTKAQLENLEKQANTWKNYCGMAGKIALDALKLIDHIKELQEELDENQRRSSN